MKFKKWRYGTGCWGFSIWLWTEYPVLSFALARGTPRPLMVSFPALRR